MPGRSPGADAPAKPSLRWRKPAHRRRRAVATLLALSLAVAGLAAAVYQGPPSAGAADGASTLAPNETLSANQSLRSPNGQYGLWMQGNGNLLLSGPGDQVLWASNTEGNPGARLQNQRDDGNIVLVAPGDRPLWDTETFWNPGTVLQVEDDGSLIAVAPGGRRVFAISAGVQAQQPAVQQSGGEPLRSVNVFNSIARGADCSTPHPEGGVVCKDNGVPAFVVTGDEVGCDVLRDGDGDGLVIANCRPRAPDEIPVFNVVGSSSIDNVKDESGGQTSIGGFNADFAGGTDDFDDGPSDGPSDAADGGDE